VEKALPPCSPPTTTPSEPRPAGSPSFFTPLDSAPIASCFGIAKNHPFIDGNKRVALQAMYLFLGLNGLRIDASEPSLAAWLRDHIHPR
jgi:hypothetical protein